MGRCAANRREDTGALVRSGTEQAQRSAFAEQGHPEAAEELYRKALSIAREQEARLWELRIRRVSGGWAATRVGAPRRVTSGTHLRLVHRGLRHPRSQSRKGAARRVGMSWWRSEWLLPVDPTMYWRGHERSAQVRSRRPDRVSWKGRYRRRSPAEMSERSWQRCPPSWRGTDPISGL